MRFIFFVSLLLCRNEPSLSRPIIYEGYPSEIFTRPTSSSIKPGDPYEYSSCYSKVFATKPGEPTTSQYLAMFSDKWAEHSNGRIYTSKNSQFSGLPNNQIFNPNAPDGLWEVVDSGIGNSCVRFKLHLMAGNVGQVVATSRFGPIQIIAVDQATHDIYGYYEESSVWSRKTTKWKPHAIDGTLWVEPDVDGEGEVAGLTTNNRMFHLWGDFNVAKHDHIQCAAPPTSIGDWVGFFSGSRGAYCPRTSNNQLTKWTWHSSGAATDDLGWTPASKITRLGTMSNIYGVSMSGELLVLWDEKGVAVHSVALNLPSAKDVRAVGGLDDGYAKGVFISNGGDKVYNVRWENGWKEKEIEITREAFHSRYDGGWKYDSLPIHSLDFSAFFGARDGIIYLLHGWSWNRPDTYIGSNGCKEATFYLTRFDFVGGAERYKGDTVRDKSFLLCGAAI